MRLERRVTLRGFCFGPLALALLLGTSGVSLVTCMLRFAHDNMNMCGYDNYLSVVYGVTKHWHMLETSLR